MKLQWNSLVTLFPTVAGVLLFVPALAADRASTLSRMQDGQPNVEGYWDPEIGGTFSLTSPWRGGVGLQGDLGVAVEKHAAFQVAQSEPRSGTWFIFCSTGIRRF